MVVLDLLGLLIELVLLGSLREVEVLLEFFTLVLKHVIRKNLSAGGAFVVIVAHDELHIFNLLPSLAEVILAQLDVIKRGLVSLGCVLFLGKAEVDVVERGLQRSDLLAVLCLCITVGSVITVLYRVHRCPALVDLLTLGCPLVVVLIDDGSSVGQLLVAICYILVDIIKLLAHYIEVGTGLSDLVHDVRVLANARRNSLQFLLHFLHAVGEVLTVSLNRSLIVSVDLAEQ